MRETCEVIAAFLEKLHHGSFEGNEQAMSVNCLLICLLSYAYCKIVRTK